jgi:Family of unknown function (DUF6476)
MNEPILATDKENPLDPEVIKIKKKLTRLLFTSVGTMILGVMALIAVIVYKITRPTVSPTVTNITLPQSIDEISQTINLPKETRINFINFSHPNIFFDTTTEAGERIILIFNMEQGKIVNRYTLNVQK